ncbi:MFS transporter [Streptomyces sp. NPDC001833]|uniref:MFS transporter n=1 Tax=Streptomyces sp. NPDC001833 TaxID=3154658 RepID=UPI00331BCB14
MSGINAGMPSRALPVFRKSKGHQVVQLSSEPRATAPARRSLVAATFGNVIEWYEWSVYGVLAPFIAAAMFSSADRVSALLSTFAVFGAGFLMRPLGGLVFGRIADRRGRKAVLMTTLLLMGGASLATGLAPAYDVVGPWASAILLGTRLVQGFAHGGESAASNSYVAEIAPTGRRGLWSSIVFVSVLGGTLLAAAVSSILLLVLGESAVADWAWRLPFLLGGVLALVVLLLRRRMEESKVFTTREPRPPTADSAARRWTSLRPTLTAIALVCGLTVVQYTWLAFAPAYVIVHLGMPATGAYLAMAAAQVVGLACLPLWGKLSDRIGRRPVFLGYAVAVAVTQFPLTSLLSKAPWTLAVAATAALVIATATGALQAAALSELFPTETRTLGIGVAFSVSVAVFGGTTPYLNELLYSRGLDWLANVYVIAAALVTGVAAWLMPETRGIDLVAAGAPPLSEAERIEQASNAAIH